MNANADQASMPQMMPTASQLPAPHLNVMLKEASVGLTKSQPKSVDGVVTQKGESQIAVGMTLQIPITELVNCLMQFKHQISQQASEQVQASQV